jgi:hypothetical protein
MDNTITAIRIYRARGSDRAILVGGTRSFDSLKDLADWSRKQHKVYAFVGPTGQGVMRSGRRMRWCDLYVKNVYPAFERTWVDILDIPIDRPKVW